LTSLGNSGLYWTVFARNRDTAVPAEGNGDLQTLICVLVVRSRRCPTLSNHVPWQNWMAAYLGYTLRMKTLFRDWPIVVHDTHTRRIRLINGYLLNCKKNISTSIWLCITPECMFVLHRHRQHVSPSFCLSITRWYWVQTNDHRIMHTLPSASLGLVACHSRQNVGLWPANFHCPALDLQLMGDHLCG